LVDQRLLSTDISEDTKERTIEPAHESLLRQWGSLQGWLHEDFAALTNLETIKRSARDWAANANGEDWLAHRSGRLEDAERLLQRTDLAAKLDIGDHAYLRACRERVEAERKEKTAALERRLALQRRFSAAAAGLALLMAGIGLYAYNQKTKADAATARAQNNFAVAETQRNQGLITQSHFLTDRSQQRFKAGDDVGAELLALEALPDSDAGVDRPFLADAQLALDKAWRSQHENPAPRELAVVPIFTEASRVCTLDSEGKIAATVAADQSIRVWDFITGAEIARIRDDSVISNFRLRNKGKLLFTWTDSHLRGWDVQSQKQVSSLELQKASGDSTISSDGSRVMTVQDTRLTIIRLADAKTLSTFDKGPLLDYQLGDDEARVLVRAGTGPLQIFDPSSGALLGQIKIDSEKITSAVFSDDGKRLAVVTDKDVLFFDVATKKQLADVPGPTDKNYNNLFVEFSKNAARASVPDKTGLAVIDVDTGKVLSHIDEYPSEMNFSDDGTLLLTHDVLHGDGSPPTTAKIWDVATGTLLTELHHDNEVDCLRVGPDNHFLTSSFDGTARAWTFDRSGISSGRSYRLDGSLSEDVSALKFSPDGRMLLTMGQSDVRLGNVATGKLIATLTGHKGKVIVARFNSAGNRLYTRGEDNTSRVWDTSTGHQVSVVASPAGSMWGGGFTNHDRAIITVSDDGSVSTWDAETGSPISRHDFSPGMPVALSDERPFGRRVVIKRPDGHHELRDAVTGILQHELPGVQSELKAIDARFSVTNEGVFQFWNEENGAPATVIADARDQLRSWQLSEDGSRLITIHGPDGYDKPAEIRTWDVITGKLISSIQSGHVRPFQSWLNDDGTRIITADLDMSKYLDTTTGKDRLLELDGRPSDAVFASSFRRVVTQGTRETSDTIRILEEKTGSILSALLPIGDEKGTLVAFSPDGSHIATEIKNSARIWSVAPTTQSLVASAKASVPRCLTKDQRAEAFLDPKPPLWCIENDRWPYQTQRWKDWLARFRADKNAPLPADPD
jgi:WD40 repeat protein